MICCFYSLAYKTTLLCLSLDKEFWSATPRFHGRTILFLTVLYSESKAYMNIDTNYVTCLRILSHVILFFVKFCFSKVTFFFKAKILLEKKGSWKRCYYNIFWTKNWINLVELILEISISTWPTHPPDKCHR